MKTVEQWWMSVRFNEYWTGSIRGLSWDDLWADAKTGVKSIFDSLSAADSDLEKWADELLAKLLERLTLQEIIALLAVKTGNFVVDTNAALVMDAIRRMKP